MDIYKAIAASRRVLLSTHERPDADGVGCELAMKFMLDRLGKTAHVVNESDFPDIYKFLPGADGVNVWPNGFEGDYDLTIALDANSRARLGVVGTKIGPDVPLINIDHHVGNERFGTLNLVDPDVSSSGELVYYLMAANGVKIDLDIASCLWAAIVTDTGRFSHANTSAAVLRVAAELVSIGVVPERMARRIYGSKRPEVMRLQTLAEETLSFSQDGRIAWMQVTNEMHARTNTTPADTQDFVEIPKGIRGVKVAILFREGETPQMTRLSMRSNNSVDVNRIAGRFGGGGHPQASGCSINKPMDQAREDVLAAVREALDQP